MREQRGLGQSPQPPPYQTGLRPVPLTGHDAELYPEDVPPQITDQERGYAPARAKTLYDDQVESTPSRSSVRRYDRALQTATPRSMVRITTHQGPPPYMQRASRMQPQPEQRPQQQLIGKPKKPRRHWLFHAGLCLFMMLFGFLVLSMLANWWRVFQDDWHYGKPRTYQTDADVGHGGMSHFTVENLGGQILVIEVPLHEQAQAKLYSGPTLSGENAALTPVTVTFEDVNGDGLLDMILHVDGSSHAFLNSKNGFQMNKEGNP